MKKMILTNEFDASKAPRVSKGDIMEIAYRNPILHRCLTEVALGNLSYEEAMMLAVKVLVGQNEDMFRRLVEIEANRIEPRL